MVSLKFEVVFVVKVDGRIEASWVDDGVRRADCGIERTVTRRRAKAIRKRG
jgi:hypothetical protein